MKNTSDHKELMCQTLISLGNVKRILGEFEEAKNLVDRALKVSQMGGF